MVNSGKACVRGGLFLLVVLLAGGGCRMGGSLDGDVYRAEGPKATEAKASTGPGERNLNAVAVDAEGAPRSGPGGSVSGMSGGESLEGIYVIALTECLYAGRLTFQDQKIRLTRQEQFTNWAAIDGRFEDATPVRIKGEDLGAMRTKVLFTVGTRKSDLNKALVRILKEGFEEHLLVASREDP